MEQDRVEYYMRKALEQAAAGLDAGELPIGAVVVVGDALVAAAHTRERAEGRFLVHADWLALDAADRLKPYPGKRRDAKLFVNLEPCLMCLGAAMSSFVGEVYFGLESPGDGAVSLLGQWHRREDDFPAYQAPRIVGGILRQESLVLFETYAAHSSPGAMRDWAQRLVSRARTAGA